jgi:hypothetical protein
MALPDHFEGEDVIITMEKNGAATVTNVEGRIMSWNMSGGSSSTDEVFAFGGKTFNFQKPREKFTVSFEVMVNDSDFDFVQFNGNSGQTYAFGNLSGKVISSADIPDQWRIIMWFQSAASHLKTGAVTVPNTTVSVYRMIFCDCKAVTFDKEFGSSEYMKGTLTFEFSATDSDGYANFFAEEGLGTTSVQYATSTTSVALASLASASGKGLLTKAKGSLTWSETTTRSWTGAYST